MFTVQRLKEKQDSGGFSTAFNTSSNSGSFLHQFTGILYAYLTSMDIDSTNAICSRWSVEIETQPQNWLVMRNNFDDIKKVHKQQGI